LKKAEKETEIFNKIGSLFKTKFSDMKKMMDGNEKEKQAENLRTTKDVAEI